MEGENLVNESVDIEFEASITTPEYIGASYNALQAVSDMDMALLSNEDKRRVKRIRKKALKIIDYCMCELHDCIFDTEEEDDE